MCLSFLLATSLTLPVCEVSERPDRETKVFPSVVKSIAQVDIVSQVDGEILEMGFEDGSYVKKGAMLYRLEDVRYVAEVKNLASAHVQVCSSRPLSESSSPQSFIRSSNVFVNLSVHQKRAALGSIQRRDEVIAPYR